MAKKQGQSVGDNSTGIQVDGDLSAGNTTVNINGLSLHEVTDLVSLLFELNLPKIQAIAEKKAEERITAFGQTFFHKLAGRHDVEDIRDALAEPNTQYVMVEVLKQVARKKRTDSHQFLAETISQCISVKDNDALSQLCSDAAMAASKLTLSQLKLLALIFVIRDSIAPITDRMAFDEIVTAVKQFYDSRLSFTVDMELEKYDVQCVLCDPFIREDFVKSGTFAVNIHDNHEKIITRHIQHFKNPRGEIDPGIMNEVFGFSDTSMHTIEFWDRYKLSYYRPTTIGRIIAIEFISAQNAIEGFPGFDVFYPKSRND